MRVEPVSAFEKLARREGRISFFKELLQFLGSTKKWWLVPVLLVLLLLSLVLVLSGTAAAPFLYTLF